MRQNHDGLRHRIDAAIRVPAAISSNAAAMKINCPISTPTLKNSSASGIEFCGRPTSASALANPSPCSNPNVESHDPWVLLRESGPSLPAMHDLGRDEDDAQCDQRFDGWTRHVQHAERCQRERNAVRDRECRDGCDQASRTIDDQQQGEHEQQVIEAEQDVADAEHGVGLDHLQVPGTRRHREARIHRQHPTQLLGAVGALQSHQHVHTTPRKLWKFDRFSSRAPSTRMRQRSTAALLA